MTKLFTLLILLSSTLIAHSAVTQTPSEISLDANTKNSLQTNNVAEIAGIPDDITEATNRSETEKASYKSYDESVARVHGLPPAPKGFFAAFYANFGGLTGDIVRAVTEKKFSNKIDPSWNVDSYRLEYRSNYSMDYWDSFENIKNKADYELLVKKSIEAERRSASIQSSPTGSLFGWVFDPIIIFIMVFMYRGLKVSSYLRTISPIKFFLRLTKNAKIVVFLTTLWVLGVALYVFLFEPYGSSMYYDDYIHMLKVTSFPIVLTWIGYVAYPKIITPTR